MDQTALALTDSFLIAFVAQYTKSSPERLLAMNDALRRIDREGISGDVVECGVWRGGNIILARLISPARTCWLYDTFAGMTLPEPIDVTRKGKPAINSYLGKMKPGGKWSAVSREEVASNLRATGTHDQRRLRFIEGPVEQTLTDPANLPQSIALLRLDTDWHASTKIELEVLYPLLEPGGVLIIDDYGHWLGARKAVDDYFGGTAPAFRQIDYTAVMAIKP